MDYSQVRLKLLYAQLKDATKIASQNAMTLIGILFQRAWLQGVLVSALDENDDVEASLLLDDSTGVVKLSLNSPDFRLRPWKTRMCVMVIGGYNAGAVEPPMIKIQSCLLIVHKIVDLSAIPDPEVMWYLEVMEAYKLFYGPLIEELV
ncbi:uncharacterized protein LOC132162807 [Corylus avellana]|uniref:uncharacterized protein LOC132162807 n=1 Tax=Corylus avellana TaxID=13451 RepID=UPI00286A2856|nr:uncharacterized protein LOC132162807 [Corylus avellana]